MLKIKKICARIKGNYICKKNKINEVSIRDYAHSRLSLAKKSIKGQGVLKLNPNAISRKEYLKLRIDSGGVLNVGGTVSLYTYTNVHVGENAMLSIGNGTYINEGTKISVRKSCYIGENCAISNDVTILDSDFHCVLGKELIETGVVIGDHVWIGADVTILKNVKIGDNCIIGARSVVLHDVPSGCMVAGNPAVIIRENVEWK